jgi:hypothetical protein
LVQLPVEVPVAVVCEIEIKHVEDRTRQRVERLIADLPQRTAREIS